MLSSKVSSNGFVRFPRPRSLLWSEIANIFFRIIRSIFSWLLLQSSFKFSFQVFSRFGILSVPRMGTFVNVFYPDSLLFMKVPTPIFVSAIEIKPTSGLIPWIRKMATSYDWDKRWNECFYFPDMIYLLALFLSVFLFHTVQRKRKDNREHKKRTNLDCMPKTFTSYCYKFETFF